MFSARRRPLLWRHLLTRHRRAQVQGRFLPQQGFDRPPYGDCRLLDCIQFWRSVLSAPDPMLAHDAADRELDDGIGALCPAHG
jgi:hypothetical protein